MALTITATITVNDDEAYTAREAAILSAFQAHPAGTAAPVAAPTAEPVAAPAAAPKATPKRAPKAAPAPEAEASTTPAVLDTTLDTEPSQAAEELAAVEEPDEAEALVGTVGEDKEYTLDDAVTLATSLINEGKVADVKAALAKAGGAKRVSELKGAAIGTFVTALQA